MRSAYIVLLISAAFAYAEIQVEDVRVNPKLQPAFLSAEESEEVAAPKKVSESEEFQDVVDYLNENLSGNDMVDIIECFSDAMDDMSVDDEGRSFSSAVEEVFEAIPWAKVNQYIQGKLAGHPKFAKLYSMLNDPKFKQLLNAAVDSQALRNYVKSVEANGFTWSTFVSFAMKAICETALVSHHDTYSEGVCKALKNL